MGFRELKPIKNEGFLPWPGDHALLPYPGVFCVDHGVISGVMDGVPTPKYMPPPTPPTPRPPISIPSLHFSASSNKSKQPKKKSCHQN